MGSIGGSAQRAFFPRVVSSVGNSRRDLRSLVVFLVRRKINSTSSYKELFPIMYTISKGPSQIVAKTRRGLAQKLESMDSIRDMTRKSSDLDEIESSATPVCPPRPVFQTVSSKRHCSNHRHHKPEILTRAQQDLIKYVYERWQRVNRELKTPNSPPNQSSNVTYYQDASPNPALQDFEPLDLEGWWGRRLYHTLTQSV